MLLKTWGLAAFGGHYNSDWRTRIYGPRDVSTRHSHQLIRSACLPDPPRLVSFAPPPLPLSAFTPIVKDHRFPN